MKKKKSHFLNLQVGIRKGEKKENEHSPWPLAKPTNLIDNDYEIKKKTRRRLEKKRRANQRCWDATRSTSATEGEEKPKGA